MNILHIVSTIAFGGVIGAVSGFLISTLWAERRRIADALRRWPRRHVETLDSLLDEWEAFCRVQGWEARSPYDVGLSGLTERQREFVLEFRARWIELIARND